MSQSRVKIIGHWKVSEAVELYKSGLLFDDVLMEVAMKVVEEEEMVLIGKAWPIVSRGAGAEGRRLDSGGRP